ncbi:MAG: hypothetical protein WA919_26835 [Coleofasciculaceae cyanobacterium]
MGINRRLAAVRAFFSFLIVGVLFFGLLSCQERIETSQIDNQEEVSETQVAEKLSEVAPPQVIQQLSKILQAYQPQVSIVNPSPDQMLEDTSVSVEFQVQDLPIFKDPGLGMGPHLNVILDNQPYQEVYDLEQPLVFEDLSPGTHTLRVFAVRPWQESFKNEGAYAQTTFHLFTKTTDNKPEQNLPLLTYNSPQGNYGTEPIMLDFYLTNAPLHLVASESPDDDIVDWRIRVTANGESFILDRWQSFYLKGFKQGKNWLKLEFLDELGNPVKNAFNNTVRLINYHSQGQDTLSRLMRGEISAEVAMAIVAPNYREQPPLTVPPPSPSAEPTVKPTETEITTETEELPPAEIPATEEPTTEAEIKPTQTETTIETEELPPAEIPATEEPTTEAEIEPTQKELTTETEELTPAEIPATEEPTNVIQPSSAQPEQLPESKPGNSITSFFSRFRNLTNPFSRSSQVREELEAPSSKSTIAPSPVEVPSEVTLDEQTSSVEETTAVEEQEETPQPTISPSPVEVPTEARLDEQTSSVEEEIKEVEETATVK